jgi:hypothetical protein
MSSLLHSLFASNVAAQQSQGLNANVAQQQQGYGQAIQSSALPAQGVMSQQYSQYAQNAALSGQQQLYNTGSGKTQTGNIVGHHYSPATSTEIDHEAYNVSIATLLDLWVTRYGNEWINLEVVDEDQFFQLAYRRLKQMGQLEVHYLTDRARYVCRKPK